MPTGDKSNTGQARYQETDVADVWIPFRRRLWLFVVITSSSLLSCLIRVYVGVLVAYNDAVCADTVTDSSQELHSGVLHVEWPAGRGSVVQRLPDCFLWFSEGVQRKRKDLDAPSQYGGACSEAWKLSTALFVREVLSRTDNLARPMLFFVSHCFPS